MCLFMCGCASSRASFDPDVSLIEQTPPYLYSDADWSDVLQRYVHEGRVNYTGLTDRPGVLRRYYALLSKTGPSLTPDQFSTRSQSVSYWINAYNAAVLLAVIKNYPVESVYDLALPSLDYGYTFMVDGKSYTLAAIESKILAESSGDVRTFFVISRAAVGAPRLPDVPIRPATLERQLSEATWSGLNDANLLRIIPDEQVIEVWQVIFERRDAFIEYWRAQRRVNVTQLYDVLLQLASPSLRRALQGATGYTIRQLPFNRELNDWKTVATSAAAE